MSVFDRVFDFFFGWLIPDQPKIPYAGGVELNLEKPNEEPLIYGEVKNVSGVIVRSQVFSPNDYDDIPNDILFLQVVWSVGQIESVDQIYLNDLPIDSDAYLADNADNYDPQNPIRWAYHWNSETTSSMTLQGVDGMPDLTFDGKGCAYSVIRLEYDPEKMAGFPKITADIKGRKISDLGLGAATYTTNYSRIIWDYMTHVVYGANKSGRLNKDSFESERDFSGQMITPYAGGAQQPLMSCNVRLDCNDDLETNLNKLIKGCRGFLPYINGEFYFIIERERVPTTFKITDENRIANFTVEDNPIKDRFNRVYIRYFDREQKGKVATATYPVDESEYNVYYAEDDNQELEKTFTLDTVNNEYEALQAGEIILKRSRNALRVKTSTTDEGRDVSVGMVVPVSNAGFGMVDKPFIVTSKANHSSGRQDFELLEYQPSIYPWNEKPEKIIPDTSAPEYWKATTPTNLRISVPDDASAQAIIEWDSPHNSFLVALDGRPLGTIGVKYYKFLTLELGTHEFSVVAYNNLGYPSRKATLSFDINIPSIPTITVVAQTFEVEINLSTPTRSIGQTFEVKLGTTPVEADAQYRGAGDSITIVGLNSATTYYVFARTVNTVGKSAWVSKQFSTDDGSKYSDLIGLVDLEPIRQELETIPRAWDGMVEDIGNIFGDAIGDKETIVNTKRVEAEAATRAQELSDLNQELQALNGLFPITETNISDGAISTPKLQANSVTALKIVAGAVLADKIASNAVTADKLSANSVTASKIAVGAIISDKIAANAVLASKIAAGAITADKIAALAITGDKIAANTIESDKLVSNIILGVDAELRGKMVVNSAESFASVDITKTSSGGNAVFINHTGSGGVGLYVQGNGNAIVSNAGSSSASALVAGNSYGGDAIRITSGDLKLSSGSELNLGTNFSTSTGATSELKTLLADLISRIEALEP